MQGQGNMAMPAFKHMAAVRALHKGGETAAIEKQKRLLLLGQSFPHGCQELHRKQAARLLAGFHVHHAYLRQWLRVDPCRQVQKLVLAGLRSLDRKSVV